MTESGQVTPMRDRSKAKSHASYLVLLVFLPLLVQAVTFLKILFQNILVRNDITYPEGESIYAFLMAVRTGNLYSNPFQSPLNVQPYGPVFYLIGAAVCKLVHGNLLLTTELMRTLSLLSFLGSIGLIGYLSWRLERLKLWTAITVILGLICPWAVQFAASARSDSLSIFFIISALTVYQVAQGGSRIVFWAGVLGSIAFLTKQSTAPVLLALAIDTVFARRFRNTAALIGGSLPIPALFMSELWFHHEPFLANLLSVGMTVKVWSTVLHFALYVLHSNLLIVIPLCALLLGAMLSWRKERYRAILLAAAVAFLTNIAALANSGGDGNYFMLPWLLMILMVPAGLIGIEEWARRSFLIPVGLTLLGAFVLWHGKNLLTQKPPANIDASTVSRLEMLSDFSYLEIRSRQPELTDPLYYNGLALQGLWSFAPITQKIDREEYDLVLIRGYGWIAGSEFSVQGFRGISYWGAGTLNEIDRHYRTICEVPNYIALAPRDKLSTLLPEDIEHIFRQPCRASNRTLRLSAGMH